MASVAQYLADRGAKLDVRNSDAMRPLDIVLDGIANRVGCRTRFLVPSLVFWLCVPLRVYTPHRAVIVST
jgi:hypothetical protein